MRWHTCGCPQWDEQRLEARATQLIDRNPHRRLFQPPRTVHQQPVLQIEASTATRTRTDRAPTPASSVWQSDWSEHSEWEADWEAEEDFVIPPPQSPTPTTRASPEPQPYIRVAPIANMPTLPAPSLFSSDSRARAITEAM